MSIGDQIIVLSNLVVAVAAALALYVGWRQIGISRELSAIEAYENYHILCLQYPQFSAGTIRFEELGVEELDSYTVFVHYTIMTAHRIYSLFPKDRGWTSSIEEDIRIHRRFIASPYFSNHLKYQSWKIKPLIDQVVGEVEGASAGSAGARSVVADVGAPARAKGTAARRRPNGPRR